jgi:uncharacterized protein YcnI
VLNFTCLVEAEAAATQSSTVASNHDWLLHRRLPLAVLSLVLATLIAPAQALAHVIVQPIESPGHARQQYTIAVPSEKRLATVRVEIQFPPGLLVTELESPSGWRVTPEVSGGQILGAVWDGGSIPTGQFATFGVLAENPTGPGELVWSAIQTYEDGSEVQWTGPEDSEFPATRTRVQGAAGPGLSDIFAATALAAALAALIVGILAWRGAVKEAPGR